MSRYCNICYKLWKNHVVATEFPKGTIERELHLVHKDPKYCYSCYCLIGEERGWTITTEASTGRITDVICYRC